MSLVAHRVGHLSRSMVFAGLVPDECNLHKLTMWKFGHIKSKVAYFVNLAEITSVLYLPSFSSICALKLPASQAQLQLSGSSAAVAARGHKFKPHLSHSHNSF